MGSLKVISVFGTRPEAIKMLPVVRALKERHPLIESKVLVTAQHREMLDQVLADFGVESDYDLDVMRPNQTLAETTKRVLEGLTPVLEKERPHLVLVHGDTTTTGAAALAAYYLRISVAHVEAGLRTGDKYAPFPEEVMRKIADIISDLHFAPTENAKGNLLREGYDPGSIFVTGNTAVDSLLMTVRKGYRFKEERLNEIDFESQRNILVEVHRRENFGEGMENIGRALARLTSERTDIRLLVSVHRNPKAREPILRHLKGAPRTVLFDPIDYPDYVNLMSRAYLIITDSGGVQEEAPSLGVPTLICREKTERPEALRAGTTLLVGTDIETIVDTTFDLLDNRARYERMSQVKNPFGDGRASERIVKAIMFRYGLAQDRPEEFSAGE
ncbi:MAG: non-hydrolyzing UDP-N-acetylglucosamine 2-epimerase [Bacillota bacterium]|nr:UDP-N-acetylglucosamine 2-epimerase (non-hydrolyzing) [Candidatus Fermentithermobacillaceae bacterium]